MCDHYTNEVNGSAVLTIRWMPPSGTVPLYVCVCYCCVHLWTFFGVFAHRSTAEHKKVFTVVRFLRLCPRPSLPAGASLSARGTNGALNPAELSFELYKGFRRTNDFSQAITSGQISGAYSFFIYLFFANYKC